MSIHHFNNQSTWAQLIHTNRVTCGQGAWMGDLRGGSRQRGQLYSSWLEPNWKSCILISLLDTICSTVLHMAWRLFNQLSIDPHSGSPIWPKRPEGVEPLTNSFSGALCLLRGWKPYTSCLAFFYCPGVCEFEAFIVLRPWKLRTGEFLCLPGWLKSQQRHYITCFWVWMNEIAC